MNFMLEYYVIKLVDVDALLHVNAKSIEVISDVRTTHLIYLICFQNITPPQFQQVSMVCIIRTRFLHFYMEDKRTYAILQILWEVTSKMRFL